MQNVFTESIKDTIRDHDLIRSNEHIVIGLSGGPDSMCLFHVLYDLRDEYAFSISAVHLNHRFRPGAAEEDAESVKEFCDSFGIYLYSKTLDVNMLAEEWGMTSEEAGRKARYMSYREEAERVSRSENYPIEKIRIAVGHNKNDQAETVLLRILRGTGVEGLAGIPYKRKDPSGAMIIRPLLDAAREDIEAYCNNNDLPVRTDKTNAEPVYKRNKIRLELIPELEKEYNPRVTDALVRLSKAADSDKSFFERKAERFIEKNLRDGRFIKRDALLELSEAERVRVIKKIFALKGLDKDISEKHIEAAESLLRSATGKITEFADGYRMRNVYEEVEFYRECDDVGSEAENGKNKKTGELKMRILPREKWDGSGVVFDADALEKGAGLPFLRTRKEGDHIKIENGTKKIKDLFIDWKIPRNERDTIPLVAAGDEIIWVVGRRISASFNVNDETERVLILEYIPVT